MTFTAYARLCGTKLTNAQRVFALVAYDGIEPANLHGTERALAAQLFGPVNRIPPDARHVVVAVCGARAGKSYVLCALRLLHLALIASLATLAPGEIASGLIVAPDTRLARQTLRFALGAAKAVPAIAALIVAETSDSFTLRREDGRHVIIECLPATRGGSAVRGRSLVGAVLDEAAFFRDSEFIINDAEVYKAIAPRIMPGGQLIIASTPWAESGLLFVFFRDNHGNPSTCIAAQAPTALMRPDARTRAMVDRERQRDPDNARREFEAEFMTAGSGLFLDPAAVDACIREDLFIPRPGSERARFAGADFGFRSDSSAAAIIECDEAGNVALLALEEQRPSRGKPLQPSAVCAAFAKLAKSYGISEVSADGHYAESVREHLREKNIRLHSTPSGQDGKTTTYLALRKLINEGRLLLPRHARLIAQLKALRAKPMSGGGLQITSPRLASGGHGDLVSALVCTCHRAAKAPKAISEVARRAMREQIEKPRLTFDRRPFGYPTGRSF